MFRRFLGSFRHRGEVDPGLHWAHVPYAVQRARSVKHPFVVREDDPEVGPALFLVGPECADSVQAPGVLEVHGDEAKHREGIVSPCGRQAGDPAALLAAMGAVAPMLPPEHRKFLATVFRVLAESLED